MNVYLESVGCRVNFSEVTEFASQGAASGHCIVLDPRTADIIIVNTCAVTSAAERKSRRRIGILSQSAPSAQIAAVGCYASLAPDRCARLPGVSWVITNEHKQNTLPLVAPSPRACPQAWGPDSADVVAPLLRTRAFLKVQDGCDGRCSYCVTRRLRGRSRSRPLGEVVQRAQVLIEAGCKEIVLTGVSLGSYGRDLSPACELHTVVAALLRHTDAARLRLSSLEPWDVDEKLLGLWGDQRLCQHLHLPLQSGCDETLERMGRPISTSRFAQIVESARSAASDLAVTTDLIAGFPGEDESAFQKTCDYACAMAFARMHVFAFSPRAGTKAQRLADQVPPGTRRERASRLRELGRRQADQFHRRFIGKRMEVLWEHRRADGSWQGLTHNYLRVTARAEANLHNRLTTAYLARTEEECLVGEVVTGSGSAASQFRDA